MKTIQIRHVFDVYSGSTPESGHGYYWDGEILWVTPEDLSNLQGNCFINDTKRKITKEGYDNSGAKMAPPSTVVLSKRAPIGLLGILAKEACSNQGCFLLVAKRQVNALYYYYYLAAFKDKLQILGRGSTFMELSLDDFKSFKVPDVDIETQNRIANFTHKEVTRLDELINTKQQQIDLLTEKRQALITQAVTKGLNPKAKLKDSGVEWLGEVPEGWEVERTKWLFKERNERSETGEEELLTVSHITGVTLRSEKDVNMFEAETNEGYKICEEGDLVINTLWAWMGAMGVSKVRGIVSPAYHVYTPSQKLLPEFVDMIVRTPLFADEVRRYSTGVWSSRLRLYPEGLYETCFPVPPRSEQDEIVKKVKKELEKLEQLRSVTEKSINLLQERKAALITAAVTGEIEIV